MPARFRDRFLPPLCLLAALVSLPRSKAQSNKEPEVVVNQAYLREHYTKFEYNIPMRDGVKLFAAVYAPKDQSTTYPILLTRTPYGVKPYSEDRYPEPGGPLKNYARE